MFWLEIPWLRGHGALAGKFGFGSLDARYALADSKHYAPASSTSTRTAITPDTPADSRQRRPKASDFATKVDHCVALLVLVGSKDSVLTLPLSRLNVEARSHVIISSNATALHQSSGHSTTAARGKSADNLAFTTIWASFVGSEILWTRNV